jgi:FKBP-type peptidyl-prolyl cis-trans isomerase
VLKRGVKIIFDIPGTGPELKKGDRVRLTYDILLNRGDALLENQEAEWTVGERHFIAGFRYGLEGMRPGGTRRFKASPHLCYRDTEVAGIPKNAVLVCDIKHVVLLAPSSITNGSP